MMDANERLARELMGWHQDTSCDGKAWYENDPYGQYEYLIDDWHPDEDDAQADMILRAVAEWGKGHEWKIRVCGFNDGILYSISLYRRASNATIYDEIDTPNRNEHIVKAAIAALDAEKPEPEPHRCERMPGKAEWRKVGNIWWAYYVDDEFITDGHFCHKCGADLNE